MAESDGKEKIKWTTTIIISSSLKVKEAFGPLILNLKLSSRTVF